MKRRRSLHFSPGFVARRCGVAAVLIAVAVSLLAVAASASWAACATTAACLQRIEAAQRQTRTLTARFVQTKHLSLLDEPLVSTGRLVFKAPDQVLWQVETPQAATVLIRGREVHIPNLPERDRQALAMAPVGNMFAELGRLFAGSLQGLEASFAADASDEGDAVRVTLVPRKESWQRAFRVMTIRFAEPELLARDIQLEDALGDRLQITLSNVVRNGDVPDSIFAVP